MTTLPAPARERAEAVTDEGPPDHPTVAARAKSALTRHRAGLVLVVLFLGAAIMHVLWLADNRRALPIDVDEAGYLTFAMDDLRGWHVGGLSGFFHAATAQSTFGPLLPMTAAPVLGVFGHEPYIGMTTQLVFLAVLVIAVYGLGTTLRNRRTGLIAAGVVLAAPGIVYFTRTFHFVLPVTAFFAFSTFALVRSRRLSSWIWTLIAGASLGLMILSRTYAVAFVPGFVIAAVCLVIASSPEERIRAIRNAALGVVTFLVVAQWWYRPNWRSVYDYLTGFGYGSKSTQYANGGVPGVLDPTYWTTRFQQFVSQGLYVPITVLLLVAIGASAVAWFRRERHSGDAAVHAHRSRAREFLGSPLGVVTICGISAYVVLSSSHNSGTGFQIPLVPLAVVVGVSAMMSLTRAWRVALGSLLVVACVGGVLAKDDIGPLVTPHCVEVPGLSCLTVTNGSDPGFAAGDADRARRGEPGGWVRVVERATRALRTSADATGVVTPAVFFSSRDPFFNTNTIGLQWRFDEGTQLPVGQLLADEGGNTAWNFFQWMAKPEFGQPNFLFATDRGKEEYRPRVRQDLAEYAARCLGFRVVRTFRLPDRRQARLYERMTPIPADTTNRNLRALLADCSVPPPAT